MSAAETGAFDGIRVRAGGSGRGHGGRVRRRRERVEGSAMEVRELEEYSEEDGYSMMIQYTRTLRSTSLRYILPPSTRLSSAHSLRNRAGWSCWSTESLLHPTGSVRCGRVAQKRRDNAHLGTLCMDLRYPGSVLEKVVYLSFGCIAASVGNARALVCPRAQSSAVYYSRRRAREEDARGRESALHYSEPGR